MVRFAPLVTLTDERWGSPPSWRVARMRRGCSARRARRGTSWSTGDGPRVGCWCRAWNSV